MSPTFPASPFGDEPDSYLPSNGDRSFSTERYDLELDYRIEDNYLSGRARIRLRTNHPCSALNFDLGPLRVQKVNVFGRRGIHFTHRGPKLKLRLGTEVPAGTAPPMSVMWMWQPTKHTSRPSRNTGFHRCMSGVCVATCPLYGSLVM